MQDTLHLHLRKSISWYNSWHNHPRHQHTHWLLFVVFVVSMGLFVSGQINIFDSENQYLLAPSTAHAGTGQIAIPAASEWTHRGVALRESSGSSWDQYFSGSQKGDGMLSASSIVKLNGTYYLYYIGAKGTYTTGDRTGPGNRALGVATSSDGINFTKYSGNPIITYQPQSDPEEGVFVGIGHVSGTKVYMYYGAIKRQAPKQVDVSVRLRESTNGLNFTNDKLVYEVADKEIWPYTAIFANNQWMVWAGKDAPVNLLRGSSPSNLSPTNSQLNSSNNSVYGYGVVDIGNGKIAMLYNNPVQVAVADATNPTSWKNVVSYSNIIEGDAGKTWFLDTERMLWFLYLMNPNGDTIDVYTAPARYETGPIPPSPPPPTHNPNCFGNDTNPPPPITSSNVNFIDQDVSGWNKTTTLKTITYKNIGNFDNAQVCLDFDKTDVWPDGTGVNAGANANAWVCAYRGGKWECGTFEWMRPGKVCKAPPQGAGVFPPNGQLKSGSLRTFWPQVGETYGFMVSGLARSGPNNVEERSDIVMSQWQIPMKPPCPGIIPPSPPPPPPTGPPHITGISPIKAVPGQTVEIYGINLVDNIKLEFSNGSFYTIAGAVNFQRTTASFVVPLNFSAGIYKVSVTGPNGSATSPQNLEVVVGGPGFIYPPTLPPPTQGLPTDLGELIEQIFGWSLNILGIAVFVMFFYSGFLWLTAAGNTAKIGEAKTHMTNAVFGAILLLSAYLILYTINPDFVKNTITLPGLGT